jgi:hypothetical protein
LEANIRILLYRGIWLLTGMGWGTRRFVRLEISKHISRKMHDLISTPDISRTPTSSKRKIYACNSIIGGNPANRFSIAICWDFQSRRDLNEPLKPCYPIDSTLANGMREWLGSREPRRLASFWSTRNSKIMMFDVVLLIADATARYSRRQAVTNRSLVTWSDPWYVPTD